MQAQTTGKQRFTRLVNAGGHVYLAGLHPEQVAAGDSIVWNSTRAGCSGEVIQTQRIPALGTVEAVTTSGNVTMRTDYRVDVLRPRTLTVARRRDGGGIYVSGDRWNDPAEALSQQPHLWRYVSHARYEGDQYRDAQHLAPGEYVEVPNLAIDTVSDTRPSDWDDAAQ